jgi:DNA-binding MarR family transcriptional regulator
MNEILPPYRSLRLRRILHVHSSLWYENVSPDITSVQYGVLYCLFEHGTLRQRDILGLAQLDKSTLAELLQRMEQEGNIVTDRDPEDKRRKIVSITPAGRRRYRKMQEAAAKVNDTLTSGLTPKEQARFDELVEKIIKSDVALSVD